MAEDTERIVLVKRRITTAVTEASRANIARLNEARKVGGFADETREKLRAAQSERRERERQERAALGLAPAVSAEKKPPGRPRKEQPVDPAPKRPRGRPKKTDGQIPS